MLLLSDALNGNDRLFDAGHVEEGTKLRTALQLKRCERPQLRKSVALGIMPVMDKTPSRRALAFIKWMESRDLRTKRVAITAGVPQSTLASFVQGISQSLKGETEEKIATAYDTTVDAIFAGAMNTPSSRPAQLVRIIGQVGADASGSVVMTTAHDSWDMAPPAPGGTSASVALDVRGDSMHTFAENGALIYFEDQRAPLDPELIGVPCVVETEDGRVLVKRPKRGSQPGLYDLESDFGAVIRDVRLRWAAEITAVIPPRQARRIIVKASDAA